MKKLLKITDGHIQYNLITYATGITSRYDYNNENDRQNIAYISGLISVNYNYLNGALGTVVRGGYR